MRNYPMWLTLGILSGLLWGCNNYLYDMGTRYADIGAVPSDGILFPLVCTAINDMSAAVFLLMVHGCRGVLRSIKTLFNRSGFFCVQRRFLGDLLVNFPIALVFFGQDRLMHWLFLHSILSLAVFWRVYFCAR